MTLSAVVAMTANNRPKYLHRVLQTWEAANDLHKLPFIFQVEPVMPMVMDMCKAFPGTNVVNINPYVYGALGNPWHALNTGFEYGADFVILAEDDSVVSPDVLDYFYWASTHFQGRQETLAVCSFNHFSNGRSNEVFRRKWFASVVWGTWRNRWEQLMREDWGWDYGGDGPWDTRFVRMMPERNMNCLFPCVSRSQHIGEHGTHMDASMFHKLQADSLHVSPRITSFKEVHPDG